MFMSVHIWMAAGRWKRRWSVPCEHHVSCVVGWAECGRAYGLESQLHERCVVQLPDLILRPVIPRRRGIDSLSQNTAAQRFRWWWRDIARHCEGIVDRCAERSDGHTR